MINQTTSFAKKLGTSVYKSFKKSKKYGEEFASSVENTASKFRPRTGRITVQPIFKR